MTERMQTKSVPMSAAMIERIRVRAEAERRTWSQVVRMLIEAGEQVSPSLPAREYRDKRRQSLLGKDPQESFVGPSEVSEEG